MEMEGFSSPMPQPDIKCNEIPRLAVTNIHLNMNAMEGDIDAVDYKLNETYDKKLIGFSKSLSCTNEWCGNATSLENSNRSKMILSNSSASFQKSKNCGHYCCNSNRNGLRTKHFPQISIDGDGEREHWDKKIEFLLAVIGFAVDLGNVWRFPYVCYRNGGGAFLISYCIMFFFGGLPLFYLELAIGQYYSRGCLTIWKRICPIMKGLGYAICIIDIYMAMYYNTIIAWAFYYLFVSIKSIVGFQLPWQNCNNPWNTPNCQTMEQRRNASHAFASNDSLLSPAEEYFFNQVLKMDKSPGIDFLGPIQPSLAFCLMLVFIVVYFSIWKGVKSTGKAVWVTALMPYFVIFVFLIRGATLDGAADGVRFYLTPDWDKLYSLNVWIDAATQIFFSLGPGFGTLMALASYNKFHNNCYRDAMITAGVNCLTSFIAGFGTFSILGYMAKKLNKDISTVAANGPGLVFIVFPEAISTMYGSVFFSILFFVMLITLGLDSTFGGLEAMITGLCDDYPNILRKNREKFVAVLITIIYFCALPTTTYGGNYLINLLDNYGTSLSLLVIVFIETFTICWLYGSEKISLQIKEMLGEKPNLFWRTCWRYVSPLFLGFISLAALLQLKPLEIGSYLYPTWSIAIGWMLTFSSLSCVPIYAIYHVYNAPGDKLSHKLINSFKPSQPAIQEGRNSHQETIILNENKNNCNCKRNSVSDAEAKTGEKQATTIDISMTSIGELV